MPEVLSTIEVFSSQDEDGIVSIGLVVCDPSIVEYGGDLTPGCLLTVAQARSLAAGITELADQLERE